MHKTQYSENFRAYCDGFKVNTGTKNPNVADEKPPINQNSMSSTLVFDPVK